MVDKRYYEKLGGFAYLLGELREKLGTQQTDILINDAVKNYVTNIKVCPKRKRYILNG